MIITLYLKVLEDEWQNSQKSPESLKTTKLENFFKRVTTKIAFRKMICF